MCDVCEDGVCVCVCACACVSVCVSVCVCVSVSCDLNDFLLLVNGKQVRDFPGIQ